MTPEGQMLAWVIAGIVLVLVLGSVMPRIGGGLLLLLVIGMVYSARTRGLI